MADSLDTLDAIMAGLHTLAADAESVADEQLRARMTGAIVGLRAAVLTCRDQVLQMHDQHDQVVAQARQQAVEAPTTRGRGPAPRMKWGCYQFDDTEGLFCTACYDKRNRRIRTMRYNSENLYCPNCRMLFPVR